VTAAKGSAGHPATDAGALENDRTSANDRLPDNASPEQVQAPVDRLAVDQALLDKINAAVAATNEAEKTAETAKAEVVSRSKVVGELLLEAKKRYPKVADFEAFLKRVNGLKLSRAYDLMRLAGGRITDTELRKEERERRARNRAKKKLPPAALLPLSGTVPETSAPQVEPLKAIAGTSAEDSAARRKAENAAAEQDDARSAHARKEFRVACDLYLMKMSKPDLTGAIADAEKVRQKRLVVLAQADRAEWRSKREQR
jgi:hypothetical protein